MLQGKWEAPAAPKTELTADTIKSTLLTDWRAPVYASRGTPKAQEVIAARCADIATRFYGRPTVN